MTVEAQIDNLLREGIELREGIRHGLIPITEPGRTSRRTNHELVVAYASWYLKVNNLLWRTHPAECDRFVASSQGQEPRWDPSWSHEVWARRGPSGMLADGIKTLSEIRRAM